jgi:N6-adenosine-specific RNA methylase IME4
MSAIIPAPFDRRENLPGLLARAGQRLLDARDAAEVLEAKKLGEFALHLAKVTKAANETHADCLRIITRAEMRMADEIDRGQAAGEVRTQADNQLVRVPDKLGFEDLGIARQRLSEWREIRDAGESVVETAITKALSEGRAPTKAEILETAKGFYAERADAKRAARDEMLRTLSNYSAPLPQDRKYPILYVDPPWPSEFSKSNNRTAENHYPTMSIEEILALPVARLATPDAMLLLWAPPIFYKETMEAWGFEPASTQGGIVWAKQDAEGTNLKKGTGKYFMNCHEILWLGKRIGGNPIVPRPDARPPSVISAPRLEHSAKPAIFYDIIERMYPGLAKIELFARRARPGWDAWGNQAEARQESEPETQVAPSGYDRGGLSTELSSNA